MKQFFSILSFVAFALFNLQAQNAVVTSVTNNIAGLNDQEIVDLFSSVTQYRGVTPIGLHIFLSEGESQKIRGLENRFVTTGNVSIQAFDLITEQALGNKDLVLTGSGSSKIESCKNLVRTINQKKSKISSWLTGLDTGTIDCDLLAKRANLLTQTSQFSQAYTLANNSKCQENAFELKEAIISAYQTQSCEQDLRQAEAMMAIKDYERAIQYILRIDPDAYCGENINELIEKIEESYQADVDQSFEFYKSYLQSAEINRRDRSRLFDIIILNTSLDD